jgi:hypothetical protein
MLLRAMATELPGGNGACPLRSNTGHINVQQRNAAWCQAQTYAVQQNPLYFDHLVGAREQH